MSLLGSCLTRRALSAFAGVLVVLLSKPAAAQGHDPAAAETLFKAGREARARGDTATACARFAESQRLDPAPGTLLNVADCEEKAGKLASSYAHFRDALEGFPKGDARVDYARTHIASLKPRVPMITVTLLGGSIGARVMRDDVELRDGSLGVALPVDPGAHVFVVRAQGRQDVREEVTFHEGERVTLTLHVGNPVIANPSSGGAPQASASAPAAAVVAGEGGGRRALGFGAVAVGGAALVTGVVTGLLFASSASTYEDHCGSRGCDEDGLAAASRGKTLNIVSPVAFGVGVLGVGIGTYLLLTPKRTPSTHAKLVVSPDVSPQTASLSLTGRF